MKNILDWLNRWLKIIEQRGKLKDKAIETKKLNTTTKQREKPFEGKFEALRYQSVQHIYNCNPRMKDRKKILSEDFCKLAENICLHIQQDQWTCKQDNHEENQS